MQVRVVPTPRRRGRRSTTTPLRQKGPPSPSQRLVRTQADLAGRAPPDATPASGSAQPAGKSVPRTIVRARSELLGVPRAALGSLADSTKTIVRRVARSDQYAPRFAVANRRVSFWES